MIALALPNLDLAVEVEQINNYLSKLRDQSPYDDEINDLIDDILQKGGKRIRPLICLLSFEMISNEIRSDLNYAAACALEIIHNASLLIDDIYDKDFFRRKEKSFYLKYSTFAAISLTYSMSSFALSLATKTNVLEVVDELIKVLHTLSTSLFLEKQFRSGERKMSKDEALQLIDRKTSCLFEAASVIGVIMGTSSKEDREEMVKFGKLFGRAFQLRDDLLSLLSTAEELGKSGVMTDISNRIQTYIVLEAIDLADNLASVKMIIPLDPDFPILGGKTLKANAGAELAYANGRPIVILKGISVWGVPIPNAWLGNLKNVDLVKEFGGDEGFWKSFSDGVENIRVIVGELKIKLKE